MDLQFLNSTGVWCLGSIGLELFIFGLLCSESSKSGKEHVRLLGIFSTLLLLIFTIIFSILGIRSGIVFSFIAYIINITFAIFAFDETSNNRRID